MQQSRNFALACYSNEQESITETAVTDLTTVQKLLLVVTLTCAFATCFAQRSSELSADFPDSRTMVVQEKVERIFDAGDYERAFGALTSVKMQEAERRAQIYLLSVRIARRARNENRRLTKKQAS